MQRLLDALAFALATTGIVAILSMSVLRVVAGSRLRRSRPGRLEARLVRLRIHWPAAPIECRPESLPGPALPPSLEAPGGVPQQPDRLVGNAIRPGGPLLD